MFDHIHFRVLHSEAFSTETLSNQLTDDKFSYLSPSQKQTILQTFASKAGIEFYAPIKMDNFVIPPINNQNKAHLNHLIGFNIFYCDSHFYTGNNPKNSYDLFYTYQGTGKLTYRNKSYNLTEGDGFLIDCNEPYTYQSTSDEWIFANVSLQGPVLPYYYEQFISQNNPVFSQSLDGTVQNCLENILSTYSSAIPYRDFQVSVYIDVMLTDLLVHSLDTNKDNDEIPQNIKYLIRYVEQNYMHDLTIDYLSDFCGISRAYMSRLFKKYTGYSPNAYIIQLRIDEAKRLLVSSNLSVTEIAFQVGFSDINNFTNLFKKNVGTTPSAYKKENNVKHMLERF